MLPISGYKTSVLPDQRGPLLRLSRMSLCYLAWANGNKQVTDDMPKDKIIKILEIEPEKYLTNHPDGTWSFKKVKVFADPQNGGIKIGRVDHPDSVTEAPKDEAEDEKPVKKKGA